MLKGLLNGDRYGDRVDYVGLGAKDSLGLHVLLVRPDRTVAWVAEENVEADMDAARDAVQQCFGY